MIKASCCLHLHRYSLSIKYSMHTDLSISKSSNFFFRWYCLDDADLAKWIEYHVIEGFWTEGKSRKDEEKKNQSEYCNGKGNICTLKRRDYFVVCFIVKYAKQRKTVIFDVYTNSSSSPPSRINSHLNIR